MPVPCPDVLCIGHVSWDVSLFTDGYPEENSKAEIQNRTEGVGGPAATAACLLAAWGWRTAFAGAVGEEREGTAAATALRAQGVDTTALECRPGSATPLSVILVNRHNASRTIINRKGSGLTDRPAFPWTGRPRVILTDGHEPAATLAALDRWPDAVSVLDAGSVRPGTRMLAPRVTHTVASARFASGCSGLAELDTAECHAAALRSLTTLTGRPAVITLGEAGCIQGDGTVCQHIPAFPVPAVDTTGAGDVFHGAFVHGLLHGWEMAEILRFASAAGALSTTRRGGSLSIPTLAEVLALAHS